MTESVVVPGLDGSTPLGFLAGLGLLKVLNDLSGGVETRLSWMQRDRWSPVLHGQASLESVIAIVHQDALRWADVPVLRFCYPKLEKNGVKLVGALRPPVAVLRQWLKDHVRAGDLESLAYAAALTTELAYERTAPDDAPAANDVMTQGVRVDPDARLDRTTMATFFDFTSRNAQFLQQVEEVRKTLTPESIALVLQDGRPDPRAQRTLDWENSADAPGAIFGARSPGYRPAAEWLAFRGLVFFPVCGTAGSLQTTACTGRRKTGEFTWVLWDRPASTDAVASLMRYSLATMTLHEQRALGLTGRFKSRLTKKADGYTGMFAPSAPV